MTLRPDSLVDLDGDGDGDFIEDYVDEGDDSSLLSTDEEPKKDTVDNENSTVSEEQKLLDPDESSLPLPISGSMGNLQSQKKP